MNNGIRILFLGASALVLGAQTSDAHYGMIIPSDTMVEQQDDRTISLTVGFAHPFEQDGMELAQPNVFRLYSPSAVVDLLSELTAADVMGASGYTLSLPIKEPGLHVLYMEPKPYWEPAEDAFIIHHTKTYVAAFGQEDGWDKPHGLVTEIRPLSKPYGLWAGNLFQGQVLRDGQPVPNAEVEVEYFKQGGSIVSPSKYMITQTIIADDDGIFSYATPASGWWGFAALTTADYTLPQEGVEKTVELGAVIWVHFEDWK